MTTRYSSRAYVDALTRRYRADIRGRAGINAGPAPVASVRGPAAQPIADNTPGWLKSLGENSVVKYLGEQAESPTNPVGWVMDALARPAYGMAAIARSAQEDAKDGFQLSDLANAGTAQFRATAEAVAPKKREFVSDVLFEGYDNENVERSGSDIGKRFAGGLAVDILTDPLTWIPGGVIAAGAKSIPGATKAASVVKEAARVVPIPGRKAEDLIPATPPNADAPAAVPKRVPVADRRPKSVVEELLESKPAATAVKDPEADAANPMFNMGDTAPELDEAAKGTLVPKVNTENAVVNATKVDTPEKALVETRRILESTKTGETRPFEARLLNLKRQERVYSDELLEAISANPLYKAVDDAPSAAPVVNAAEEVATPPGAADIAAATTKTPPAFDEWVRKNKGYVVETQKMPDGKDVNTTLWQLQRQSESANPEVASAAIDKIAAIEADYKANPAKYLRGAETARPSDALIQATPPGAPAKAERAAEQAVRRAQGQVRFKRKTGEELAAHKAHIASVVNDPALVKRLTGKETATKEGYDALLKSLRGEKRSVPAFIEKIIDDVDDVVKPADDPLEAIKPEIVTAAEQIENAAPLDTSEVAAIARGERLSAAAREALGDAFSSKKSRQQLVEVNPEYNQRTARGALRDSPTKGKGTAVFDRVYNAKAQANTFQALIKHYAPEVSEHAASVKAAKVAAGAKPGQVSQAFPYAEGMMKRVVADLKAIDEFLWANGVHGIGSAGGVGIPLSLADVFDAILSSGSKTAKDTLMGRVFSRQGFAPGKGGTKSVGTIDVDALLTAARTIVEFIPKGVSKADLEDAVADVFANKRPLAQARAERVLQQGDRGITTLSSPKGKPPVERKLDRPEAVRVAQGMADILVSREVLKGLVQRVHDNSARLSIKFGDDVGQIAEPVAQVIHTAINNPQASIGDVVTAVSKVDELAKEVAKTADVPKPQAVTDTATQVVKEQVTEMLPLTEVEAVQNIVRITASGLDEDKIVKIAQEGYEKAVANAFSEEPIEVLLHSADNADVAMQAGILAKMGPFATKLPEMFIAHSGEATLHAARTRAGSVVKLLQKGWRHELNVVHNMLKHNQATPEDLVLVMKHLQGRTEALTDPQRAMVEHLRPVVQQIFETGDDTDGVFGGFFRNGFSIDHVNHKFTASRYGLPEKYRFDENAARQAAKKSGRTVNEELADQWKSWDIDDPLDFMARMEAVMGSVATDMAIAQESLRIMKGLNLASPSQVKGYVKIEAASKKESTIARYLPDGWFYDREVLKEIEHMDDMLRQSDSFDTPFGRFVNRYLDPILNMWKSGMTVWRPGHHVRNFVGDSALSFFADGVSNPAYYRSAIKMQRLRRQYDGWDALRALRDEGPRVKEQNVGKEIVAHVTINGRKTPLTEAEVHRRLMDSGVLPDFRLQEDLLESSVSPAIARFQRRLQIADGRAKQLVGSVSEARDDTVRIAHALHVLEHAKGFKSLDELFDHTTARVRRYHPDGADLTGFERTHMRRIFPFYSWSRKALPLVIEAMLLQPGKVLMYPKATYNFAQAQGIDLTSFSDPFPEDQLFPSFLEDQPTGPVFEEESGEYLGISPGLPTMDVLADFLPGNAFDQDTTQDGIRQALKGPINMLNPMIKAPVETLTGTNIGTGGQVHDMGEYVDSQIPGVSTFASASGYSPTGTLTSILPGGNQTGLDPQRQVTRGNKGHFDREAFFNYMLGMQVQNMSRPSYINFAEIEARNRAARRAQQ